MGAVLGNGFPRHAPTSPFAAKTAAQAVADFVRDSRTTKFRCAKTLAADAASGGGDPAPLKHQKATSQFPARPLAGQSQILCQRQPDGAYSPVPSCLPFLFRQQIDARTFHTGLLG